MIYTSPIKNLMVPGHREGVRCAAPAVPAAQEGNSVVVACINRVVALLLWRFRGAPLSLISVSKKNRRCFDG